MIGIYKIVNTVNGHCYIGSSEQLEIRKLNHFYALRNGTHHSNYLQNAYNKYEEKSFNFEVIEHCKQEELEGKEQELIDQLKPVYNVSPFVNRPPSRKGKVHTEESRRLIKLARGRQVISDEVKSQLRERAKNNRKPITQYSITGVKLREWDSVTTCESELQKRGGAIRQCCRHYEGKPSRYRSAYGYIWKYKEN